MEDQEAENCPSVAKKGKEHHGSDGISCTPDCKEEKKDGDQQEYGLYRKQQGDVPNTEQEKAERDISIKLKTNCNNSHRFEEVEDNNGQGCKADTVDLYQESVRKIGRLTGKDAELFSKVLIFPSLDQRFLTFYELKTFSSVSKSIDLRENRTKPLLRELEMALSQNLHLQRKLAAVLKCMEKLSYVYGPGIKNTGGEDALAHKANENHKERYGGEDALAHKANENHKERYAGQDILSRNINSYNAAQKFETKQSKYSVEINSVSCPFTYILHSTAIDILFTGTEQINTPPKKLSNLIGQKGGHEDSRVSWSSSEDELSNADVIEWDKNNFPLDKDGHTPAFGQEYSRQREMARKLFPDPGKHTPTTLDLDRITLRKEPEEQELGPRSSGQTQTYHIGEPKLCAPSLRFQAGQETESQQMEGSSDTRQVASDLTQQGSPSNGDLTHNDETHHHQNQTSNNTDAGSGADRMLVHPLADFPYRQKGLPVVSRTDPELSRSLPSESNTAPDAGSDRQQAGTSPATTHQNAQPCSPAGEDTSTSSSVAEADFPRQHLVCHANMSAPTPFLPHPEDEHGPSRVVYELPCDDSHHGAAGFTPGSDAVGYIPDFSSTQVVSQESAPSFSQTSSQDPDGRCAQAACQDQVHSCNQSRLEESSSQSRALSSRQSQALTFNQSEMESSSQSPALSSNLPQALSSSQSLLQFSIPSQEQSFIQSQEQSSIPSREQSSIPLQVQSSIPLQVQYSIPLQVQSSIPLQVQSSIPLQVQSSIQSQQQFSGQSRAQSSTQPTRELCSGLACAYPDASPRPVSHVSQSPAEQPRDRPAPVRRLPPVVVHAAGSLPPGITRMPRIDMSRATNRAYSQLGRRRATYDESWLDGTIVEPADLSLAGFYHIGPGRRLRCFYCGLELEVRPGDNIWDLHVTHSPRCAYLVAVMGPELVELTQQNLQKKR